MFHIKPARRTRVSDEENVIRSQARALMATGDGLHLPPSYPDDRVASAEMREICEATYARSELGGLTDPQANALLCYRDFARAIVLRHEPTFRYVDARPFVEAVAIFMSRRRAMAEGVVTMMNRRFATGASPFGLKRAVTSFMFFPGIDAYCLELLNARPGTSDRGIAGVHLP